MRNSTIESLVAAAVLTVLATGCATGARAESQAGFEASSMSSTSTASQSGGENNSQASTANTSQRTNEQTSNAANQNTSQAEAESIGAPLNNVKPGYNGAGSRVANAGASGSGTAATGSYVKPAPSFATNPLNNGDAGNSVGNVVNGVPTAKNNVTNSGTTNSKKRQASPEGNRQISDVSGSSSSSTAQPKAASKSIFAPHIVTRTYRWIRR